MSDNSVDALIGSFGSENYSSAKENSTEEDHGTELGNNVLMNEESDPPENYEHPFRFNVHRHTTPLTTFLGDPYQAYYPSQQQHFNPSFHMQAPSMSSNSSDINLYEADLGGHFRENLTEFRSTVEVGELSHSVQQVTTTFQPDQVVSVELSS